jgi:hypothetical protein
VVRYYKMDCKALHELSCKSQVWSNFKHLLILQCWQGIELFEEVYEVLLDDADKPKLISYNLLTIRGEIMVKKKFLFSVYYKKILIIPVNNSYIIFSVSGYHHSGDV